MLPREKRRLGDAFQFKSQYLESIMVHEIDDETFFNALNDPSALTQSQNNLNTANMSEDKKSDVIVRLMRLFETKRNLADRTKITLFLVRYMHRLNRAGWQAIYGDKYQYLSMIELLINNRHEPIVQLSHEDLTLVLKEGMRVGSDHAYETYLRLTLLCDDQEGFENQEREGRVAAASYAKRNKKNFLKKITENGLFSKDGVLSERQHNNKVYLEALSEFCKDEYFYSFKAPTDESAQYLAKVLDEGHLTSETVFQMAIDLEYSKIIFMLGQYHARKALNFSEQGNPHQTKAHVDYAEKCFDYLRELPMLVDKVKLETQHENYGKVLKYLAESRVLEADVARQDQTKESKPTLPYILLGANYGHQDCVAILLALINREGSDEAFEKYIDKYMARLPVLKSMSILNELLHYKEGVLSEARKQIVARKFEVQQQGIASLEALPSSLQYEKIVEGGIALKLEYNNDLLEVHSGGSSVYMVVTKVNEDLNPEEGDKPQNDEYKLYVAFDPYKYENYPNCWRALLNDVLGEDNVYGVKMMNPKDAELDYDIIDHRQRALKENAQPGKMAVIYFKKYDTLKKIRGEGYTQAQFYLENLALIEKFERALKAAGVTNDKPSVVPDHSLPAQVKREGDPLVFISGRETDANGKYVPSKDRPENTLESNPYTNKAILAKFYGEKWVASKSEDSFESAPSRSSTEIEALSASGDASSHEVSDLDQILSDDPEGKVLDAPASTGAPTGDAMQKQGPASSAETSEENDSASAPLIVKEASTGDDVAQLSLQGPALSEETSFKESPSASFITKPKPSFFNRVSAYYKTNPWKAAGLTIGAVLSVGLVTALSVATAGVFPLIAGGIAAAATALHITVVGASIGAFIVGGLSTLGFGGTLSAMLFRTARQLQSKPAVKSGSYRSSTRASFEAIGAGVGTYNNLSSESSKGEGKALSEPTGEIRPVTPSVEEPQEEKQKEKQKEKRPQQFRRGNGRKFSM